MAKDAETERMCIVTRRREPPEAMIRFVRAPSGALAPDIRARLPGRGVWVTARREMVAEAVRKKLFGRGLKESVEPPPEIADDVDRLLEADCLQMLALANKAGAVVAGFGKVADALEKGVAAALIEAADGAEDGRRKLAQIDRRLGASTPIVGLFASAQLDLALGRVNVIHAALEEGGPAAGFLARCQRLAAYRGLTLDGCKAARQEKTEPGAAAAGTTGFNGVVDLQDRELDERERE